MANLEIVAQQLKVNNEQNMAGHELVAESVERLTRRVDKFLKAGKMNLIAYQRMYFGVARVWGILAN